MHTGNWLLIGGTIPAGLERDGTHQLQKAFASARGYKFAGDSANMFKHNDSVVKKQTVHRERPRDDTDAHQDVRCARPHQIQTIVHPRSHSLRDSPVITLAQILIIQKYDFAPNGYRRMTSLTHTDRGSAPRRAASSSIDQNIPPTTAHEWEELSVRQLVVRPMCTTVVPLADKPTALYCVHSSQSCTGSAHVATRASVSNRSNTHCNGTFQKALMQQGGHPRHPAMA
jgi:hypothetical protein